MEVSEQVCVVGIIIRPCRKVLPSAKEDGWIREGWEWEGEQPFTPSMSGTARPTYGSDMGRPVM